MKIMSPNYGFGSVRIGSPVSTIQAEVQHMWSKPEYTEMRFGFEVTMYIANR
jgi:coenzyme PQQ precursor peptide PqqA